MADAWSTLVKGSLVTAGDAWTRLQNLGTGEGTVLVEDARPEIEILERQIEVQIDDLNLEILAEEMDEVAVAEVEIEEASVDLESSDPEIELEW